MSAFDAEGGETYLRKVARDDPKTFCTLLGEFLPLQVNGDVGGKLIVEWAKEPIAGA